MEQAVNKMTGHTASVFGMIDRGVIRAGAYADLVLFNPATLRDTATFDTPALPADGILETWINGESAYIHGIGATAARAGRLITRNHRVSIEGPTGGNQDSIGQ
jgi:N-acyl-D-amino-acid deacylase